MLPLIDVALAFGWLGLTAFGGPVAHLAFFRRAFVERRGWLDEAAFAEIVALCQVLPGPTSSEVAFALGKHRAGWAGAVIAWAAFALPSAVLMTAFALLTPLAAMGKVGAGVIHGLKLAAVAIVAQALWGMATTLAPDRARASIAVVALGVVMLAPGGIGQIAAIGLGAVAGWVFCRGLAVPVKARAGAPVGAQGNTGPRRLPLAALIPVGLFVALFAVGGSAPGGARLFAAFYRSGALVFGGGHVVLPLLHDAVTGAGGISDGAFLAGYGAAQALPGPLFSIAAYLGALSPTGPGRK